MSSQKASTPRSKYLSSLTDEELKGVLKCSRELEALLGEWVKKHPRGMREVRVPQLSLTLAAAAPFLGASELLPGACLSMWFFAVDDLLDEAPLDKDTRRRVARVLGEQCPSLIREPRSDSRRQFKKRLESLLAALSDIRRRFKKRFKKLLKSLFVALSDIRRQFEQLLEKVPKDSIPRERLAEALKWSLSGKSHEGETLPEGDFNFPKALRESLARSLELSLRGMRFELIERNAEQPLPAFRDYLEEAHHSVGVLPVYVCMLAAMKTTMPSDLPLLLSQGQWAALKIRLANDLRSYQRELLEGKLNSIGILKQDIINETKAPEAKALEEALLTAKACLALGLPPQASEGIPQQAHDRAKRLLAQLPRDSEVRLMAPAAAPQPPGAQSSARYAKNLTAFVCDFYAHYDYHDSLKATGWDDIDARTTRS